MRPQRIEPGPGQESVWDYPRPPRLEDSPRHLRVLLGGEVIADSRRAKRVLETSHPPTFYIPPEDFRVEFLTPVGGRSICEWKGQASYFDVAVGERLVPRAVWTYERPTRAFASIAGYFSLYPGQMDECTLDGEVVQAQAGDFYGGWITREIVGPFKGATGTWGW